MTQAQHTPGPWSLGEKIIKDGEPGCSISINAPDHYNLAVAVWRMNTDARLNRNSPTCEANARLIAAAPDMLAELVEQHSYWQNEMIAMRDLTEMKGYEDWQLNQYRGRLAHAKAKAERLAALIAKARGDV